MAGASWSRTPSHGSWPVPDMPTYINTKTGITFESATPCAGGPWVIVDPAPAQGDAPTTKGKAAQKKSTAKKA